MQPYARNALIALAFMAGWLTSSWRHDSLELVANKAASAAYTSASANELTQAKILQDTLSRLSANEKTIIRENVKIVDRPVYRNICLDSDGLRNANAAKNGTPSEPADGVPKP